jgi:hypothetical protein
MPFRNGIQFDLGNVYLCNPDGDVVREFSNMKLADVQEFDDTCYTEDPGEDIWGKIDYNKEISFNCRFGDTMQISRMWKILYGWKAKGPVRKRVLGRLWGLRR